MAALPSSSCLREGDDPPDTPAPASEGRLSPGSKGMAQARVAPSGDQDRLQRSTSPYLALVELVQADGTAINLAGPAPEWFAGMVPPCFQRQQPLPNVLLQVQL